MLESRPRYGHRSLVSHADHARRRSGIGGGRLYEAFPLCVPHHAGDLRGGRGLAAVRRREPFDAAVPASAPAAKRRSVLRGLVQHALHISVCHHRISHGGPQRPDARVENDRAPGEVSPRGRRGHPIAARAARLSRASAAGRRRHAWRNERCVRRGDHRAHCTGCSVDVRAADEARTIPCLPRDSSRRADPGDRRPGRREAWSSPCTSAGRSSRGRST